MLQNRNEILLVTTGGTIDGHLSPLAGKSGRRSRIPPLVRGRLRVRANVAVKELMAKDSRAMSEGDLEAIAKCCRECRQGRVVVTHGTYGMERAARHLAGKKIGKTIVLTGAHVPLGKTGDAEFNLGSALMAARLLPRGVWVVTQGEVFAALNVTKNLKSGFFQKRR
ncbi:Uncharacterised protein [uncultured archaeon]|nr:Uncharacterised protein [uncultured archaeon]